MRPRVDVLCHPIRRPLYSYFFTDSYIPCFENEIGSSYCFLVILKNPSNNNGNKRYKSRAPPTSESPPDEPLLEEELLLDEELLLEDELLEDELLLDEEALLEDELLLDEELLEDELLLDAVFLFINGSIFEA